VVNSFEIHVRTGILFAVFRHQFSVLYTAITPLSPLLLHIFYEVDITIPLNLVVFYAFLLKKVVPFMPFHSTIV
jgi:hypothetical protein